MKKIKILYIIDVLYSIGGTEINLLRLLTNLDKGKFDTIVCPLEPLDSPMIQTMKENGIKVEPINVPRIYDLNAIRQAHKLIKFLRGHKIDIVQTIHLSSDIFGTLVARCAGIPIVISSRRDMGFDENKRMHRIMRRVINGFVDRTITNSNVMKQEITKKERISGKKILTIYNGLDVTLFNKSVNKDQKAKELSLNPAKPIVGVIANIRPIKGLEFFIEAASKVVPIFPSSQFIIVGGDATFCDELIIYKNKLDQMIQQLGLENYVFFLGSQSEIAEILAMTDIYVLPSLSEGFSNTILEAMAASKPVVATDVGGNSEAVLHSETGLIVPPKDSDAIANAVITLLKDKQLAEKMGQSGRIRIEKHFSIGKMVHEMEILYCSLENRN